MARKKRSKKNKNIDIVFVILLILSVIMAIVVYLQTGTIGEYISPIIGAFVGPVKYVIPVGVFFLALATTKYEKKSYSSRIIQFVLVIFMLSAMFTILEISKENFHIDSNFGQILSKSFEDGKSNIGGRSYWICTCGNIC